MLELKDYLNAGETTVSNLLLTHYHHLGLSNQEFLLYLQLLHHQQSGSDFPDLFEIGQGIGVPNDEIYTLLEGLLGKQMIRLVTTQNHQGKMVDAYDLTPIYERLNHHLISLVKQTDQQKQEVGVQELFELFEKEFGRPLSPIEMETISMWIQEDKYDLEIIRLGLREAVLNQAYSLKYIDRILLGWERKNLRTKDQVLTEQRRRKKSISDKISPQAEEEELPQVPLYNWVDQDKESS